MELARYRDISRIYLLIIGAFSVTFFVRYVMIGYIAGGAYGAVLCGSTLFIFLILGAYILYFGLEKWDRFYSEITIPQPVYPYYPYYQPQYYPPPAYYPPPTYGQPAYTQPQANGQPVYPPPQAYGGPAYSVPGYGWQAYGVPVYPPQYYGYQQPAYGVPAYGVPAYRQPAFSGPQAYGWPGLPVQTAPEQRPFVDYAGPHRYIPKAPAPPKELDPRRALMLPEAMTLLAYFLAAVFVGALALLTLPYLSVLSVLVFLPAFVIGFSFPSLIWISYVYSFEKVHVLPSKTILKAFVYGMLSTIPALFVNTFFSGMLGEGPGASLAVTLVVVAVVAPIIEEFSKPWGILWVGDDVRGRLDGLILGVTCGVGFALIENITYEFSFVLTGESAAAVWSLGALARGLGSIMVHATGAGLIGYAYGRYKMTGNMPGIALAYLLAVAMHAAWNGGSTILGGVDWGIYATVPFMIVFVIGAYFLLRYFIDRGAASEAQQGPPSIAGPPPVP